jgi:hypothetical protein
MFNEIGKIDLTGLGAHETELAEKLITIIKANIYYLTYMYIEYVFIRDYCYPITTKENLERIAEIYNKHEIKRYESICSYLAKDNIKQSLKKSIDPTKMMEAVGREMSGLSVKTGGFKKINKQKQTCGCKKINKNSKTKKNPVHKS